MALTKINDAYIAAGGFGRAENLALPAGYSRAAKARPARHRFPAIAKDCSGQRDAARRPLVATNVARPQGRPRCLDRGNSSRPAEKQLRHGLPLRLDAAAAGRRSDWVGFAAARLGLV